MADYMDDLFSKIKTKKGKEADSQKSDEPKKTEQKVSETTDALRKELAKAEQKQAEKVIRKPEIPAMGKPMVDAQPARRQEPVKTVQAREGAWESQKPAALQGKQLAEETRQKQQAEEVEQRLKELRGELPPQERLEPDAPDRVPEAQKSQAEKELETKGKQLIEEYGSTKIYKVPGQPLLYYWTPVVRPVGAEKTIINTIKEAATRIISIIPYRIRDQEQRRNVYYQKILEILRDSPELQIPKTRYEFYAETVVREMVGYGIIDTLIKDDKLEEIMVIGPKLPVYVFHRQHDMMITNIEFYADNEIQDLVNRIARQVGRRVDLSSPLLDARLPDGSRVNATIPPASVQGSTLTIRKFREEPYSIVDLIKMGTLDSESAAFLWLCVEGMNTRPANILIAGGTGSGKTTTLNVLAAFIPDSERIITIEDTAELNLPLKHWIRLEARPPGLEGTGELTLDILTKNSLRMRPDRIVVGEIRHDEAFSLFTAFNTGHDGSLGTVHANSPEETIVRVTSPPMNVPQVMLSGLNFILVQHRLHDKKVGTIRRITEIAEVTDVLKGKPSVQTVYKRDAKTDTLKKTKNQIKYLEILGEMTGNSLSEIETEIQNRTKLLSKLSKEKNITMKDISEKFTEYLIRGG